MDFAWTNPMTRNGIEWKTCMFRSGMDCLGQETTCSGCWRRYAMFDLLILLDVAALRSRCLLDYADVSS